MQCKSRTSHNFVNPLRNIKHYAEDSDDELGAESLASESLTGEDDETETMTYQKEMICQITVVMMAAEKRKGDNITYGHINSTIIPS